MDDDGTSHAFALSDSLISQYIAQVYDFTPKFDPSPPSSSRRLDNSSNSSNNNASNSNCNDNNDDNNEKEQEEENTGGTPRGRRRRRRSCEQGEQGREEGHEEGHEEEGQEEEEGRPRQRQEHGSTEFLLLMDLGSTVLMPLESAAVPTADLQPPDDVPWSSLPNFAPPLVPPPWAFPPPQHHYSRRGSSYSNNDNNNNNSNNGSGTNNGNNNNSGSMESLLFLGSDSTPSPTPPPSSSQSMSRRGSAAAMSILDPRPMAPVTTPSFHSYPYSGNNGNTGSNISTTGIPTSPRGALRYPPLLSPHLSRRASDAPFSFTMQLPADPASPRTQQQHQQQQHQQPYARAYEGDALPQLELDGSLEKLFDPSAMMILSEESIHHLSRVDMDVLMQPASVSSSEDYPAPADIASTMPTVLLNGSLSPQQAGLHPSSASSSLLGASNSEDLEHRPDDRMTEDSSPSEKPKRGRPRLPNSKAEASAAAHQMAQQMTQQMTQQALDAAQRSPSVKSMSSDGISRSSSYAEMSTASASPGTGFGSPEYSDEQGGMITVASSERKAEILLAEQRRRKVLGSGFDALLTTVPTEKEKKYSKAQLLNRAVEYIRFLKKKQQILRCDLEEIEVDTSRITLENNRMLAEAAYHGRGTSAVRELVYSIGL